ncbi:MAG: hypothetical protein GKS06_01995 [Acidobacteria bacterium]|nr:hypothetical protein [Acidobacteriota bacterium]
MKTKTATGLLVVAVLALPNVDAHGQFDDVPIPAEMKALEFMVGEWTVDGAFRTPDHVAADRTLWYLTRNGGVTRFDGQGWTAYVRGESETADGVLAAIDGRSDPFAFSNTMDVSWAQDGFVLLIDEGRTSGTAMVHFDTARQVWASHSIHAASNSSTTALAPASDALPVFEGRGVDRRGERIFQRRYEVLDAGHFAIRTSVSFDDGVTWIEDQIVQSVRRR